jgi:hypothetical protein
VWVSSALAGFTTFQMLTYMGTKQILPMCAGCQESAMWPPRPADRPSRRCRCLSIRKVQRSRLHFAYIYARCLASVLAPLSPRLSSDHHVSSLHTCSVYSFGCCDCEPAGEACRSTGNRRIQPSRNHQVELIEI